MERPENSNDEDIPMESSITTLVQVQSGLGQTAPPSYHNSPTTNSKGPPPTYEEVIDPNAPPPSYDTLFGRVIEVRKSSSGFVDFLRNLTIFLVGTIGVGVFVITIVVPITMIFVGLVYRHECPNNEYIPIFLIVGGGFGVLKQLLHLSTRVRVRQEEIEEERLRQTPTQTVLTCFMVGWFIIGSMWLYGLDHPSFDPSSKFYCNKYLFIFAMGLMSAVYVSLAATVLCLCSASAIAVAYQMRP